MSDFQVILFVGKPSANNGASDLETLSLAFEDEPMMSLLHCPRLGSIPENISSPALDDPEISSTYSEVQVSGNEASVSAILDTMLPDLVCLFVDGEYSAVSENEALAFCQYIRDLDDKSRPTLIIHSESQESQRIQYLLQGADDILGTELSPEEFKIRLLVHLRRNLDFSAHDVTRLPGLPVISKIAQRRINWDESVALITVAIDHLDVYQENYGDLPTRQILKACAAMLSRVVMIPPDFLSQTDENHFVIITHPDKAEKLAALLCRQFEAAAPNFYSEQDRKRGYMISVISDRISRRVPLLSLSIGLAYSHTQAIRTFASLFNASQQMCGLARMQEGCTWQGDRPRLSSGIGHEPPTFKTEKPGVLVVETDAALAYLLKTTLGMEGYNVDIVSGIDDARAVLNEKMPYRMINLVILDAVVHDEAAGLLLTAELRQHYPNLRVICTSSMHNRQQVLQAGAHLYLPRPFELSSLFFWIHRLLPETMP